MTTFRLEVGINHEKLARILHQVAPPAAAPWELCHIAALRWDDLSDLDLGRVLERVKEMRDPTLAISSPGFGKSGRESVA